MLIMLYEKFLIYIYLTYAEYIHVKEKKEDLLKNLIKLVEEKLVNFEMDC